MTDLGAVATAVLGAGGAVFVTAAIKGVRELRSGARLDRGDVIQSQRAYIVEIEERLRVALADRDFWRDACAQRGHDLRNAGRVPDPEHLVPPSERDHGADARRRRRGMG